MGFRQMVFAAVLATVVCTLAGCFSANPEDLNAFVRPDEVNVTMDQYVLQPPDAITVISSKVPELRGTTQSIGHTQTIRPDGVISFETVGEIMVAGKTPREVAEIISQKMVELYKLPGDYPVDVRVNNQSKYYYILGEVRRPGAQIFTGRETTLSAISKAVITVSAWEEKTQVIRPSLDLNQPPRIFELDLKRMIEHGEMTANVLLQEGDIIYIPPTILTSIGRTIGEITQPVLGTSSVVNTFAGAN